MVEKIWYRFFTRKHSTRTLDSFRPARKLAKSDSKTVEDLEPPDCKHYVARRWKCVGCGSRVGDNHGKGFWYLEEGMRLTDQAIEWMSLARSKRLFNERKLHLVLDLDHTLIHARRTQQLSHQEKYLLGKVESWDDLTKSCVLGYEYLIKLRPFVRDFLKQVSSMFEMCIYTKGSPEYAKLIAELLDPNGTYFGGRVISRIDSPKFKTLDLVLAHESGTIIIDDTQEVWRDQEDNLIQIEPYNYFNLAKGRDSYSKKSYSEKMTDESEASSGLKIMLRVIEEIHRMYFDDTIKSEPVNWDVRLMISTMRGKILEGCTLYFGNDVLSEKLKGEKYWVMGDKLGAWCSNDKELDSSYITHVVSNGTGEEDIQWARQEKKFLVNPNWVESAFYYWERPAEDKYGIMELKIAENS